MNSNDIYCCEFCSRGGCLRRSCEGDDCRCRAVHGHRDITVDDIMNPRGVTLFGDEIEQIIRKAMAGEGPVPDEPQRQVPDGGGTPGPV